MLSFTGTWLRDKVAGADAQFAALIIVGLNTLISLLTTLTRAFHLDQGTTRVQPILWTAAGVLAILALPIGKASDTGGLLMALFAAQCGIVAVVNSGRRLARAVSAEPTSPSPHGDP